jgi:hypothetical protein
MTRAVRRTTEEDGENNRWVTTERGSACAALVGRIVV